MASLLRFYVFILIFTCCVSNYAEAFSKKYLALTSDVHKFYQTSSVFLIFSQKNRTLEEHSILHLLSRQFSKKGILTMIINFMEVGERLSAYRKRIQRPLVVVVLKDSNDIDAFKKNTKDIDKSYPIWLVIFEGTLGNPECTYCNDPKGNMFGLRFDTEMLIMCCEDPILREWWSNSAHTTENPIFAKWTQENGLELLAKRGLYARRNNVNGANLQIAIVPNSSTLVIDYGNNTVGGFFGEILQELNRGLNFTISITLREKRFGSWSSSRKNWSGVIGQLVEGNADFGVADFTMTSHRLDVIDFTLPFLTSKSRLFIRKPDGSRVKWSAYAEAFTAGIWLTILILIITTPILLTVIEAWGNSAPLSPLIIHNYLCVWGIFCQQGLCEFPTETPLRIAYLSIFISALVVSSSYSASLTSYLAVSSATLPFTSLYELAEDGSYQLIVYQDSSDYDFFAASTEPSLRQMMRFMKPKAELPGNVAEGWDQVCDERVALFTNEAMKQAVNSGIKCEVSEIDTGRLDSLAMIMSSNFQYTKIINYHIQRFQDTGMLNRLKHKHFVNDNLPKPKYDVVSLAGIIPLLSVFGCGIILALGLLFCEQIYNAYMKNHAGKLDNSVNSRKIKVLRWINFRYNTSFSQRTVQPQLPWFTASNNNPRMAYCP